MSKQCVPGQRALTARGIGVVVEHYVPHVHFPGHISVRCPDGIVREYNPRDVRLESLDHFAVLRD